MNAVSSQAPVRVLQTPAPLPSKHAAICFALALLTFHAGYGTANGWSILAFPFALVPLIRLPSTRWTVYGGLALGVGLYAPHLGFFWTIFGPVAGMLWMVLGLWIAVFLSVGRTLSHRLPPPALVLALPILWLGLEYFRSELYYLRFSWLNAALALTAPPEMPSFSGILSSIGGYGLGFALFTAASVAWFMTNPIRWLGPALVAGMAVTSQIPDRSKSAAGNTRIVEFAGAQIENVGESEIIGVLDEIAVRHPNAPLIILPEYSLLGEPDAALRTWCRTNQRHLIVGGRSELGGERFHNTAFVIGPSGEIVFQQAKSVPIQFFDDGIPAASQDIWVSPWGRLGLAVCYDLSYTRVIDRLVSAGAEGLIIPTMDALSWGRSQHEMHARVAPLRAAEYDIPIARVASSGISQAVDRRGRVTASAPFSEEVEFIQGRLALVGRGSLPADRIMGPLASVFAVLFFAFGLIPSRFAQWPLLFRVGAL